MKKTSIFSFLFLIALMVTQACNSGKKIENDNTDKADDSVTEKPDEQCKNTATVMDYTGLDGCKYMLKLENGRILLPNISSRDIFDYNDFAKARKVSVGYYNKSIMNTCMKGQTVEITCCRILEEGSPLKPETSEY